MNFFFLLILEKFWRKGVEEIRFGFIVVDGLGFGKVVLMMLVEEDWGRRKSFVGIVSVSIFMRLFGLLMVMV